MTTEIKGQRDKAKRENPQPSKCPLKESLNHYFETATFVVKQSKKNGLK